MVVEGYELNAPSNLSIDPELLILDGEESFTLTFDEVHAVVDDDVAQDAENYCISVDVDSEDESLLTGRCYKVRVSGSTRVDRVEFYDGDEWSWNIYNDEEKKSEWSVEVPAGEDQFWNKQGGSYNLLVKAHDDQGRVIGYAGLPVKVQSNGTLDKPNVFFWEGEGEEQYGVPTTTVTRGDVLRVHVDPVYREDDIELVNEHYEVRIYGSHEDFADEYWYQKYVEVYGTGDFELPTANLPTLWQDENDPEVEPVPMAYRVEVNAGADGWDGSWNYAEFTVVEPEQDEREPILTIMNENDLWVNENTDVSAYAPGATNVDVTFDGDGDLWGGCSEDYWTGSMRISAGGWVPLTAVAYYPTEDGEGIEKRAEKSVWINSLGHIGAPKVLFDSATLPEGTEELTFSFDYSSYDSLDQCYQDWDGFAIDDYYNWRLEAELSDGYGFRTVYPTDGEEIPWMPRGEGETYGPITLGADQGFILISI